MQVVNFPGHREGVVLRPLGLVDIDHVDNFAVTDDIVVAEKIFDDPLWPQHAVFGRPLCALALPTPKAKPRRRPDGTPALHGERDWGGQVGNSYTPADNLRTVTVSVTFPPPSGQVRTYSRGLPSPEIHTDAMSTGCWMPNAKNGESIAARTDQSGQLISSSPSLGGGLTSGVVSTSGPG